ncbi:MAG: RNA polymerase sigma factor [Candidatus Limnocylindria bacterium]
MQAELIGRVTDYELVQAARAGDEHALERLLSRLADELIPLASALTAGSAEADALVEDTLSRVFERLGQLERPDAVSAWARRVMVRRFLDWKRWQRRRREVRLESVVLVAEPLMRPDLLDLQRELVRLARAERALVVLRFWEDRTYDECAELLGIPVGTVKSRLARLMRKLRISLGGDSDGTN